MIMLKCLQAILNFLASLFLALADALSPKKSFAAEFGKIGSIARSCNRGFVVSRSGRLSRRLSYENLLLVGPTGSGKTTISDGKGERVKSLISADEIRVLSRNRSLILSGNLPLIKGRTSPYYRSLVYRRYAKMTPPPLQSDIPDEPLKLLK